MLDSGKHGADDPASQEDSIDEIVSPHCFALGRSPQGDIIICVESESIKKLVDELLSRAAIDTPHEVRVVGQIADIDRESPPGKSRTEAALGIDPHDPSREEKIAAWYAYYSGIWDKQEAQSWYERLQRAGPGEPDMWHNRWLSDGL
ncbi:MAG: hypothetical protein JWM56_179 [Candidatus Peribacteria bacterium]|nr:hypothetical protein [Candidatus Peribacteria bacterium]